MPLDGGSHSAALRKTFVYLGSPSQGPGARGPYKGEGSLYFLLCYNWTSLELGGIWLEMCVCVCVYVCVFFIYIEKHKEALPLPLYGFPLGPSLARPGSHGLFPTTPLWSEVKGRDKSPAWPQTHPFPASWWHSTWIIIITLPLRFHIRVIRFHQSVKRLAPFDQSG